MHFNLKLRSPREPDRRLRNRTVEDYIGSTVGAFEGAFFSMKNKQSQILKLIDQTISFFPFFFPSCLKQKCKKYRRHEKQSRVGRSVGLTWHGWVCLMSRHAAAMMKDLDTEILKAWGKLLSGFCFGTWNWKLRLLNILRVCVLSSGISITLHVRF